MCVRVINAGQGNKELRGPRSAVLSGILREGLLGKVTFKAKRLRDLGRWEGKLADIRWKTRQAAKMAGAKAPRQP